MSGMREIWAIIRRDKLFSTKQALDEMGAGSMSIMNVSGRGKQRGLVMSELEAHELPPGYSTAAPRLVPTSTTLAAEGATLTRPLTYVPKKIITMIVEEKSVKPIIENLLKVNQTGENGDGKIFVLPVDESYRIRSGESGISAL